MARSCIVGAGWWLGAAARGADEELVVKALCALVEVVMATLAGSGSGCTCSAERRMDRLLGWLFSRSPNQPGLMPAAASTSVSMVAFFM